MTNYCLFRIRHSNPPRFLKVGAECKNIDFSTPGSTVLIEPTIGLPYIDFDKSIASENSWTIHAGADGTHWLRNQRLPFDVVYLINPEAFVLFRSKQTTFEMLRLTTITAPTNHWIRL